MCHSPWWPRGQPSGRGELGTGAWTSRMRRTPSTSTSCMSSTKTSHGTNDGQKMRPNWALGKTKEKNHVDLPPSLASLLLFFFPKLTQSTLPQSIPKMHIASFLYFFLFLLSSCSLLACFPTQSKQKNIRPFTQKFWPYIHVPQSFWVHQKAPHWVRALPASSI